MQTFTGAAQIWLVVNMPATVAGTSETIRARSRFLPFSEPLPVPRRLMSQKIPLAINPRGATMDPVMRENFVIINTKAAYRSGVNQQPAEDAMSAAGRQLHKVCSS